MFPLLAGCVSSSSGGTAAAPSPEGAVAGEGAVSIEGLVVDDAFSPIAGASVAVQSTDLVAVTGSDGSFAFAGLATGRHVLLAGALGYESVAKSVEVVEGVALSVTMTLSPLPIKVAFRDVFGPFKGYFECRLGTPSQTGECGWIGPADSITGHPTALYPNDRSIFRFNLTNEEYESFVGDMRWTQGSFATSTAMRLAFSYEKRVSTHWWCSGEGKSPLQWRWEREGDSVCTSTGGTTDPAKPTMKLNPLRAYANVPFGTTTNPLYASVQQKFEVMISAFYGEAAPPDYVAFPDA